MNYAIISAEIVCSFMMLIIGYAIFTERRIEYSHMFFASCIVSVFLVLINDSLSYVFEICNIVGTPLFITNLFAIIFGDVLILFFGLYVWSIVNEKNKKNVFGKIFILLIAVLSIGDFIFEIYGAITKTTFSIVNGSFVPGELYEVYYTIQLVVLALCMLYLIINIKTIGIRTLIVFCIYYSLPAISMVITLFNSEFSFICTSIALSFLVIYIGIEKEKETRGTIMAQLLNTDIMTNLSNRNAYEEMIKKCEEDKNDTKIGVLFCDLNCLKKINDEQGHTAGDQYIIKFANILMECFSNEKVFRISGDEFVVIFENKTENYVHDELNRINDVTKKENNIASCGMSFGLSKDVIELVKIAERNMYDKKRIYYTSNGITRA